MVKFKRKKSNKNKGKNKKGACEQVSNLKEQKPPKAKKPILIGRAPDPSGPPKSPIIKGCSEIEKYRLPDPQNASPPKASLKDFAARRPDPKETNPPKVKKEVESSNSNPPKITSFRLPDPKDDSPPKIYKKVRKKIKIKF